MSAARPYETYTANGSDTQFSYAFDIPGSFSAVYVWKQTPNVDNAPLLLAESVHYTHNPNTKIIEFLETPPAGTDIVIFRFTNRTRDAVFLGGQTLTAASMNTDPNRLTAVDQEIEHGIGLWVTDGNGEGIQTGNFLSKNFTGEWWASQGLEFRNASPATLGSSLVTLDQAIGILTGGNPTFIDSSLPFCFTGDGVTVLYRLEGAPIGDYRRTTVQVYVAHVRQSMCNDEQGDGVYELYNITDDDHTWHTEWLALQQDSTHELAEGYYSDPELVFSTPPEAGAPIEAVFVFGTAQVTLPEQNIDSAQIAGGAIQIPFHIAPITADSALLRVLRFAANGAPSISTVQADWIEGFNTKVRSNRLDQMAAPTGTVDAGGQAISSVATPTGSSPTHHAANKGYVLQQVQSAKNNLQGQIDDLEGAASAVTGSANLPLNSATWTSWITLGFAAKAVGIRDISDGATSNGYSAFIPIPGTAERVVLIPVGGGEDEGGVRVQRDATRIRFRRLSGPIPSSSLPSAIEYTAIP